jgi:molybdopterin/thiamine biosynthesis adenylyltransferase
MNPLPYSGHIGIVDHDTVDISNLHRQILHTEARIGLPKATSAALALKESVAFCSHKFVLFLRGLTKII